MLKYKIILIIILSGLYTTPLESQDKKVFIHFMGWYGEGRYGNHWKDGTAHEPLIGYYSSKSWAAQLYQILLSWRCGIDGLVLNLNDSYDKESMGVLLNTYQRLSSVNQDFSYDFAISYDDQGFNSPEDAISKFTELRDNTLPKISYLRYNDSPVLFIYNYPDDYLDSKDYKKTADSIFTENGAFLVWNELDVAANEDMDAIYPWVKGFSSDGSEWGSDYLNWFYNSAPLKTNLDLVVGGVWPGFDDRDCYWGKNRWINRNYGQVYRDTWGLVNSYNRSLPMDWVYIETWNDWNEGTEIEPSVEHGTFYLQQTVDYINTFKESSLHIGTLDFEALSLLYEAARMIEKGQRDSVEFYPVLEVAIEQIMDLNSEGAIVSLNEILTGIEMKHRENFLNPMLCYFDVVNSILYICNNNSSKEAVLLEIYDVHGRMIEQTFKVNLQGGFEQSIDLSYFSQGVYIASLKSRYGRKSIKILVPGN